MRVLFINTWDVKGGAAIAMNRLRKSLVKNEKITDLLLVGFQGSQDRGTFPTRHGLTKFMEQAINKIFNWVGLQYQFFPFSSATIMQAVNEFKPDVISLHNTHGGYFPLSLLPKISAHAPVVWTLHDMWSFTGNSAHTFGDESWKKLQNASHLTKVAPAIGLNTGSWLLKQKKRIYSHSDITIVTPSHWLLELARQSPVFAKKKLTQIFNGVDLEIFCVKDKAEARVALSIPQDSRVIMFSADSLVDNPWKGGKDLVDALKLINDQSQEIIHLIVTGSGDLKSLVTFSNLCVHRTGFIADPELMVRCYSASDVFLYPTRADNLPNVLVEAIACGVPCVTFAIGGCGDVVLDNVNGVLVEPFNVLKMAEGVLDLLKNDEKRNRFSIQARVHAEKNFSADQMARHYYSLFQSVQQPFNS